MQQIDILRMVLSEYVDQHGLRPASRNLNVPIDVIKSIKDGRNPLFLNAERVMDALGYDVVFQPRSSELDTLKPDNSKRFLVSENLNKTKFNSDNFAIATALKLPKDASLNEILIAIEVLLDSRASDDLVALRDEIAALREAILCLGVNPPADVADNDDSNQISESPALYAVGTKYNNLADNEALSARGLPARQVATIEFEAAAGGGAYNLNEAPVKGQVWFRRDWLDSKGIDATQSNVISVKGESMEPTLPDGSKILVARHRCRRRAGRIFVLNTEDGLIVKRLGKDNNGDWQLISDNSSPDWPTLPWQRDMTVIGEVMWVARSL